MQRLLIGMLVLTTTLSAAFSQTPTKPNDNEQDVLKLTREWLNAEERRDRATLQRLIADDFEGLAPMGNTVFKEDVIPLEGSQSGGLSIDAQRIKARLFGETAVVTGAGVQKAGEKRDVRFTVVFARRGDRWQMVAGHLSAVPREQ